MKNTSLSLDTLFRNLFWTYFKIEDYPSHTTWDAKHVSVVFVLHL